MQRAEFKPNERPNPILDKRDDPSSQFKRVCFAALPLIRMYRPASVVASLGLATHHTYRLINERDKPQAALVVASVALEVLHPNWHRTLLITYALTADLQALKEKGHPPPRILSTLILMASLYWDRPEFMAASLLTQAGVELWEARQDYKKGQHIELLGHVAVATVRAYSSHPHLLEAHRDWFGKEVTQEALDAFLKELDGDLNGHLKKLGYRAELRDLKFDEAKLQRQVFTGLRFDACDLHGVDASKTVWNGVKMTHCRATDANFSGSRWDESRITDSDLACSFWNGSSFRNVKFSRNNLASVQFNHSMFDSCRIQGSALAETNFFGSRAIHSEVRDCDLTDALLFGAKERFVFKDCTEHVMTRPVVGLTWYYPKGKMFGEYQNEVLCGLDVIVCKLDHFPPTVDPARLESEVNALLKEIPEGVSTPKALFQAASERGGIGKLRALAKEATDTFDGLVIPGGHDVEGKLGGVAGDPGETEADLRMSIFQFALTEQVEKREDLGGLFICRGCQLLNVWKGGTLRPLEESEVGFQVLEPISSSSKNEAFIGFSAHSQACDKLGEGLELLFQSAGTPKAISDGRLIGYQFHPEAHVWFHSHPEFVPQEHFYEPNRRILEKFVGDARKHYIGCQKRPV